MENMKLSIHQVERTRLTGPYELPSGGLTYDLEIFTADGRLEVTLFSEAPLVTENRPARDEKAQHLIAI